MTTSSPSSPDKNNTLKNPAQIEQAYTYEEPPDEDDNEDIVDENGQQKQQQGQQSAPSLSTPRDTITRQWAQVMNSVNIHNMQKLVNLDEFVIEGKTYIPRRLKPREILELNKLQDQLSLLPDWNEKKFELVKKQAALCLSGWSDNDFENIDIVFLEQVLGACMLRTKGFRKL